MPYSVSLTDNQPSPRYGETGPWTRVAWEQADARSGPWTRVDVQALSPLDSDPEDPQLRDVSTNEITLYPGWVRLVWLDDGDAEEPTDPVYVGSAIRPSVQEVANLMPDRLTLEQGGEASTFTANTRPTAQQVDALIDLNLDGVDAKVPDDATTEAQRAARSIVALQTAILAEATYFSHQGDVNTARIELWERLIEQHTATLTTDPTGDDTPRRAGYASARVSSTLVDALDDACGPLEWIGGPPS